MYYVICEDNCKFESMTKEQIINAIYNAISTGDVGDVDAGFITKVKAVNSEKYITFWLGTRAEYNALATKSENCLYIITDDDSYEQLIAAFENNKGITQAEGDIRYERLSAVVTGSGAITVTVENNMDYAYTAVTSLSMTAAAVKCHGFITFGTSTPTINILGFSASAGDNITAAAAGEVWEFDCLNGYIVWKNWSAA